jgi:hypothetical protein
LTLVGCNNSNTGNTISQEHVNYEDFIDQYFYIQKTFISDNFESITPETVNFVTTTLPSQKLNSSKKNDAQNEDLKKPSRLESYYKSKNSNMIIKIDYIYNEEIQTNNFLSISSFYNDYNVNIKNEYSNLNRPFIVEHFITVKGMLISIKFINDVERNDYQKNIDESNVFYHEFEEILLSFK